MLHDFTTRARPAQTHLIGGGEPTVTTTIAARKFTEADRQQWQRMVGKAIVKLSGKPFKSGEKTATPLRYEQQHSHTPHPAFAMDDGSMVECFRCALHVAEDDRQITIWRSLWQEGVAPRHIQSMVGRHISGLLALDPSIEVDYALRSCQLFEAELLKQIILDEHQGA